jgi:hypothetical protein
MRRRYKRRMSSSYTVTLWCGCAVYVSCHPGTGLANERIVERRGATCPERRHQLGSRLWLWELLPDRRLQEPTVRFEHA